MPPLPTGEPVWDLQFTEDGKLTSPDQGSFLAEVAAAGVTDLFAFSHGWGTSQDSASQLYGQMFPMIRNAAHGLPASASWASPASTGRRCGSRRPRRLRRPPLALSRRTPVP
jgi:hypothetical protein